MSADEMGAKARKWLQATFGGTRRSWGCWRRSSTTRGASASAGKLDRAQRERDVRALAALLRTVVEAERAACEAVARDECVQWIGDAPRAVARSIAEAIRKRGEGDIE